MFLQLTRTEGLVVREWAAVLVMLLCIITLTAASFASKRGLPTTVAASISIRVVGGSVEELQLELAPGAQVVDALAHLTLSEEVDVGKLPLEAKLQPGQVLVIPTKGKVSLFVTGSVEKSGLFVLPEGSRYPDLLRYITLTSNADLKQFKRKRRLLQEGETIEIR